jgi:hypothetical protein
MGDACALSWYVELQWLGKGGGSCMLCVERFGKQQALACRESAAWLGSCAGDVCCALYPPHLCDVCSGCLVYKCWLLCLWRACDGSTSRTHLLFATRHHVAKLLRSWVPTVRVLLHGISPFLN